MKKSRYLTETADAIYARAEIAEHLEDLKEHFENMIDNTIDSETGELLYSDFNDKLHLKIEVIEQLLSTI